MPAQPINDSYKSDKLYNQKIMDKKNPVKSLQEGRWSLSSGKRQWVSFIVTVDTVCLAFA